MFWGVSFIYKNLINKQCRSTIRFFAFKKKQQTYFLLQSHVFLLSIEINVRTTELHVVTLIPIPVVYMKSVLCVRGILKKIVSIGSAFLALHGDTVLLSSFVSKLAFFLILMKRYRKTIYLHVTNLIGSRC